MDKVSVADVHADVIGVAAVAEEDEVADLEAISRDSCALRHLVVGHALHAVAVLREDVVHEARAVEAGRRRCATPDVRVADEAHGEVRDIGRCAAAADCAAGRAGAGTRAARFVRKILAGDVGGVAVVLDTVPAVRAAAGDGDGLISLERADLGAAGKPRIADIQRIGRNVHGLTDIGHGDVQVAFVDLDAGRRDVDVVPLAHVLIRAEEHDHSLLPACALSGPKIGGGAGFCTVDKRIGYAKLRSLARPCADRTGICERAQIFRARGGVGGGLTEVLDDLEKFLPREGLVRLERSVRIAAHNAVFMRLEDVFVRCIRKIVGALELIDNVSCRLFKRDNGQLAHLAARDGGGQITGCEGGGENAERLHFLIIWREPRAVFRSCGHCARGEQQHERQNQRHASFPDFHSSSSFSSSPTGQWSEP